MKLPGYSMLPNLEEIREQKLVPDQVESDTTEKTEEAKIPSETLEKESEEEVEEAVPEEKADEEVPASFQKRINELTWRYKSEHEARLELEERLKRDRENPTQPTSEEEKREAQARDYLRNLYKEIVAEEKAKESEEDKKLKDEISHVSSLFSDFQEKPVLAIMDEFGITSVESGYKAWKKMNRVVEETKEKTKKEIISKPKSPSAVKSQDTFASKFTPEQFSSKSLWELSEEIKKEAGL